MFQSQSVRNRRGLPLLFAALAACALDVRAINATFKGVYAYSIQKMFHTRESLSWGDLLTNRSTPSQSTLGIDKND